MKAGDLVRVIRGPKQYRNSVGIAMGFDNDLASCGPGFRIMKAFFPLLDGEMRWTENHLEVVSESS